MTPQEKQELMIARDIAIIISDEVGSAPDEEAVPVIVGALGFYWGIILRHIRERYGDLTAATINRSLIECLLKIENEGEQYADFEY